MHNCLKPFCIYLAQFHHLPALSSPAAPSATPKSSPPPTNAASPWSSPACATSGTESGLQICPWGEKRGLGWPAALQAWRLCRAVERATARPMRGSPSESVQSLAVRGLSRSDARPDAPSAVRQHRGCLLKTGADSGGMETALAPIPLRHHAMDMGANKPLSVKA